MTKLQKSKIRGAYKTMVKAIADYEKAVAEVWALKDNPQQFVEVFVYSYGELSLVDTTIVNSPKEATEILKMTKRFADKVVGGIETEDTVVTPSSIEASYRDSEGKPVGEVYAYFKEA